MVFSGLWLNADEVLADVTSSGGQLLVASPNQSHRMMICYSSLKLEDYDKKFRKELRIAKSDKGLRRVAGVVKWLKE